MARKRITIDMGVNDRERDLERAREALGADVDDSEVIEKALAHFHQSVDAYEKIKGEISPEQADVLSTDVVSINHYPQVRL